MASRLRTAESNEKTPVQGVAMSNKNGGGGVGGSSKKGFNRGAWTAEEDRKLAEAIEIYGPKRWKSVAVQAGLNRCGKSCRLRWLNYLRPNIKRGNISDQEEDLILRLHKLLGNRWALIAGRIPGRTDNEIKNYWNSHLSKKLKEKDHQKQVIKGVTRQQSNPFNHQRSITRTKSTMITTTTTRSSAPAVELIDKTWGCTGKVEEKEDEDNCQGIICTSGGGGATSTDEDDSLSKNNIFDVDDFFDFSNENPSSLEWVQNFVELDQSEFTPICADK